MKSSLTIVNGKFFRDGQPEPLIRKSMIYYEWVRPTQQLSEARMYRPKKKIDYENVRAIISFIKGMIKHEHDSGVKKLLAAAGIELNKILLR